VGEDIFEVLEREISADAPEVYWVGYLGCAGPSRDGPYHGPHGYVVDGSSERAT
jgi:hypothetical protein